MASSVGLQLLPLLNYQLVLISENTQIYLYYAYIIKQDQLLNLIPWKIMELVQIMCRFKEWIIVPNSHSKVMIMNSDNWRLCSR